MGHPVTKTVYTPIPSAFYLARIDAAEPVEGNYEGRVTERYKWSLNLGKVKDVNGETRQTIVPYYTGRSVSKHPKNKLTGLCHAARVNPLDLDDTDLLIGKVIVVTMTLDIDPETESPIGNTISAIAPHVQAKKPEANGKAGKATKAEPPADDEALPDFGEVPEYATEDIPW